MIGRIIEAFRKTSALNQAFERSQEMLGEDREMFEEAIRSLRGPGRRPARGGHLRQGPDDQRLRARGPAQDLHPPDRGRRQGPQRRAWCWPAWFTTSSASATTPRTSWSWRCTTRSASIAARVRRGRQADRDQPPRPCSVLLLAALPLSDQAKAREVMSEHWWISRKADDIVNSLLEQDNASLPGREAVTAVTLRPLPQADLGPPDEHRLERGQPLRPDRLPRLRARNGARPGPPR